LKVEADNTVLVARAYDRKVAIEIVLALDDLLRALRDIGGIGEGDVIGEFLLDGDLWAVTDGIGFGDESLGINLDIAGAEQPLEPAGHGTVQSLAQDKSGRLIGKSALAGLLLELCRFIAMMSDFGSGGSER
jgi:hypothetical protein